MKTEKGKLKDNSRQLTEGGYFYLQSFNCQLFWGGPSQIASSRSIGTQQPVRSRFRQSPASRTFPLGLQCFASIATACARIYEMPTTLFTVMASQSLAWPSQSYEILTLTFVQTLNFYTFVAEPIRFCVMCKRGRMGF